MVGGHCTSSRESHKPAIVAASSSERVVSPSVAEKIVGLALANVGKGACSKHSEGGKAFDTSCMGNGGLPEFWCADFARWVWDRAGGKDTAELTAAAGSFYVYGQKHGTLHKKPTAGDAVVFDYHGGGSADHVAIVTKVESDGRIETVSGDWPVSRAAKRTSRARPTST
jgi:hypothetical protein